MFEVRQINGKDRKMGALALQQRSVQTGERAGVSDRVANHAASQRALAGSLHEENGVRAGFFQHAHLTVPEGLAV